ncbi:sporulation protein [Bacillus sp. DJP31]|uniref:sporulation protein n=1 Tax=Bacillus sp. DJP31 TaxID=3409789 RepID=UPI003BB6CCAC
MLLRRYMSLIGIGSARVDLVLEKENVRPGDSMTGTFNINGGTIEQQIKRIECDLVKTSIKTGSEEVVDSMIILTAKLINSEETSNIPFTFFIPPTLEASCASLSYRFQTRMIFQEGVKSMDQDVIIVLPAS